LRLSRNFPTVNKRYAVESVVALLFRSLAQPAMWRLLLFEKLLFEKLNGSVQIDLIGINCRSSNSLPSQLRNTLIPNVFVLLAIFPLDNLKES
jgi:hypothetical protein